MRSAIPYKTVPGEAVYIAGPMRGLPYNNEQAFIDAEEELVKRGLLVFNPLRISRSIVPDEVLVISPAMLEKVMEIEKSLIENCAYIYLLKGWQDSAGAKAELAVAIRNGVKVMLQGECP